MLPEPASKPAGPPAAYTGPDQAPRLAAFAPFGAQTSQPLPAPRLVQRRTVEAVQVAVMWVRGREAPPGPMGSGMSVARMRAT